MHAELAEDSALDADVDALDALVDALLALAVVVVTASDAVVALAAAAVALVVAVVALAAAESALFAALVAETAASLAFSVTAFSVVSVVLTRRIQQEQDQLQDDTLEHRKECLLCTECLSIPACIESVNVQTSALRGR
jgi:membrane protein implicated in regulation of membrane protease activity